MSDWEVGFSHLEKFVEKNGHARIPQNFCTKEGINLGIWIHSQRRRKEKLSPERIARLDSLGLDWNPINTQWEEGFSHLEKFVEREGHTRVPRNICTKEGINLGIWIGKQRTRKEKLSPERKARLDSLVLDK